jgi:hypothetical protein
MIQSLALAVVATQMLAASAVQAPRWEVDYGKALAATRATDNQPLLVVLDNPAEETERINPSLLTPAIDVEKAEAPALGAYRLCRIDVTSEYGKKVAEVFKAKKFPYVAIIDRTGSVILHSQTGPVDVKVWDEQLIRYQDGNQPIRVHVARPNYDSGNGSSSYCPNCQRY